MKILYKGVDISADVSVHRAIYNGFAEGRPDSMSVIFNDMRRLWHQWNPQKNDLLQVTDGAFNSGMMWIDDIRQRNGKWELAALSIPQSAKVSRDKAWEDVRLLEVAGEMAGRHGLGLQSYGITDPFYPHLRQEFISDLGFLDMRCRLEGFAFLVYDGQLVLYDEAYMESQSPAKTIQLTHMDKFRLRYTDVEVYGSAHVITPGGTGIFQAPGGNANILKRTDIYASTVGEATRFAHGVLRNHNKYERVGRIDMVLEPGLAPGSVVTIASDTMNAGQAFLYQVMHNLTSLRTVLYFRKPLEGY